MTRFDSDEPTARVSAHQVEVPGTPQEVWQAIATGPGIATWFVPAEVEEREGGRIVTDHGPDGRSEGVVTEWDPPHRFGYEECDWQPGDPAAPPWATELLVEARDGGTCVVRLVSGFFRGGDGWEENLKGTDEGWQAALRNLRLSLTHFPGQPAATLQAIGNVAGRDPDDVGRELLTALGVDSAVLGASVQLPRTAPTTAGYVLDVAPRSVTLRTTDPHPGILELATFDHGGATVVVRGFLYGPGGDQVAAREAPRWTSWLVQQVNGLAALT